jgi:hypothetical protein
MLITKNIKDNERKWLNDLYNMDYKHSYYSSNMQENLFWLDLWRFY